jgi:predicted TIM-barrel fold metal-dependent hydrolase
MWECDYPHTDTTWPESQSTTQEVLEAAGVSDEEAKLITHGNAERVFNWKMASADLLAGSASA